MSLMLGLPWVPWSQLPVWLWTRPSSGQAGPRGWVSRSPPRLPPVWGVRTHSFRAVLCLGPGMVSNSQQVLLLLNCFYGQGCKRMKTTFPTQLSQPPISVPGPPQLCFKTVTFDFTSKLSSCRNTSSYLDIWREGFQAGWLAGSLSRFKFLTTWSLKTLSEGLQGQNPFHKNTKIPFLPILMIIKWKVPDITWHVIIPSFWCYYIINVFIIVICGWINT